MNKLNTQPEDDVQGPAVVTPLHVRSRPATDNSNRPITGKTAWTKWTPLESAYQQGKLGAKDSHDAIRRFNAGQQYTKAWDDSQGAGRDSTQAFCISRGYGSGSVSTVQSDAIASLVAVESYLGQRDRIIVRMVCGQGHFPSEAVAMVSPDYAKATTARFKEALDALIDAWEKVRRAPGRVAV